MEEEKKGLTLNQESMDVLVTNIIPTTKYFESRFDHMQYQIDQVKDNQVSMQTSIDKRFEQVDKRFEQVDKRFEQVDKRFEEVKDSIRNLSINIEKLTAAQKVSVRDYIIERDRYYDGKFNNLRNFNIAIITLIAGVIIKISGLI